MTLHSNSLCCSLSPHPGPSNSLQVFILIVAHWKAVMSMQQWKVRSGHTIQRWLIYESSHIMIRHEFYAWSWHSLTLSNYACTNYNFKLANNNYVSKDLSTNGLLNEIVNTGQRLWCKMCVSWYRSPPYQLSWY